MEVAKAAQMAKKNEGKRKKRCLEKQSRLELNNGILSLTKDVPTGITVSLPLDVEQ